MPTNIICPSCEAELQEGVCTQCGAINPSLTRRVRDEVNRPKRVILEIIPSSNLNGEYKVYFNNDGTISCSCHSFLYGKVDGNGECKHIRGKSYQCPEGFAIATQKTQPSVWQKVLAERLGINVPESISNAQIYFILTDILLLSGTSYPEVRDLLKNFREVSLLPLKSFGVELEHGSRSTADLISKASESGIVVRSESYNHTTRGHWKLVPDGSVRASYEPIELVSPKLFGSKGLGELRKMLKVVAEVGYDGNRSCGLHIHIDGYSFKNNFTLMTELMKAWWWGYPILAWLVAPSRINGNQYCMQPNAQLIRRLSIGQYPESRYYSLNLDAMRRHCTIENRLHGFSMDYEKISSWIIFSLLFVEAIARGKRWREIPNTDPGEFFKSIGMGDNATSFIKEARNFLLRRYEEFRAEGRERHFTPMPEDFEREIRRESYERITSQLRNFSYREVDCSAVAEGLSISAEIVQMAGRRVSRINLPAPTRVDDVTYSVQGQAGVYTVSFADGRVRCNCRGFRTHEHCVHAVASARYYIADAIDSAR